MDLLAAEDMLLFVNAATTSTGQREFHSDADAQRLSLDFLHEYMAVNYRDLYAAALALDVNDHNAALIIRRLLADPGDLPADQRRVEGRLIGARLRALPPQRAYDLFRDLRRARVNNRRTRAVVRDWLARRPDPVFDAVKYRAGVKRALRHAHVRPADEEVGAFLFARRPRYRAPLLDSWRRAHYDKSAVYELPYTVAEGFAARHGIERAVFLARIAPRLTRLERLRLQGAARRDGVAEVVADLSGMPLTRLASYVLALPFAERGRRRAELTSALRAAARRACGPEAGRWGRVAAVLDDSFSSAGSATKRNRPLAVALACHYLLEALAAEYTGLWTSGNDDPLMARPRGVTPLGERVLDAVEFGPERLVVVSDGWDNAPPGLAAEVLRVWRERLDPERRVSAVHLNPVYDADAFTARRLTPQVPTVGVRDAEDVPALIGFARLAEGTTGLAELRAHLGRRVERFLEGR
ncbi:hypothetical protein [Saccharothrix syringae]|uniref:TROVE domain-containing protein n=1 Tax=Saccharothrix syringae TaxID=103733 RepID=A0A5Q0H5H8_SACSY|nr:hypothetical protein [Saccharothrix syringae]QFZ21501.1 hypothetical protein EKG83_32585 [Saccharothrix syringae]